MKNDHESKRKKKKMKTDNQILKQENKHQTEQMNER